MSVPNLAKCAAKAAGLKTFFDGVPCKKGHIAERRTSNSECTECARIGSRSRMVGYYQRNKERKREYDIAYRAANPEKCAENVKRWLANNREKRLDISRQYTARRRSMQDGGISGGMLSRWTSIQPKVCFYCGTACECSFHVDHFIPLAKGGAHVLTNLRIACARCNVRKSARMPDVFSAMLEAA